MHRNEFFALYNVWIDFNKTWQEASSQWLMYYTSTTFVFLRDDPFTGLWLADTVSTPSQQPLNWFWRNLVCSPPWSSTPSTNFVFFELIHLLYFGIPSFIGAPRTSKGTGLKVTSTQVFDIRPLGPPVDSQESFNETLYLFSESGRMSGELMS